MDNYQTPIGKKKTRLLGMTLSQVGLLAGLLVVQLVILVLALKYIVFAPKDDQPVAIPTRLVLATGPAPTLAPTPIPDFTTAVLTLDDLPAGFIPVTPEEGDYDFNTRYPGIDLHPVNQFGLVEAQKVQIVLGWVFSFNNAADREKFDLLVAHPYDMFTSVDNPEENVTSLEGSQLADSSPIGELSTGWSASVPGGDVVNQSDTVLFSHKNFGAIVKVLYNRDQAPLIGVWEVAQKLDNRIMDVMVNGPIPTPVFIAYESLAGVKLTLEDLPAGFLAVPDSELGFNDPTQTDAEAGEMRIAGVFGFNSKKANAEEYILGYTFQFSSTMGKAAMDQFLANEDILDAMFEPTPTQKRQVLEITKPIGDRALSTAIMDMTETGGIRCDVLVFRRGHVGAALFYIYVTGRRQTTVEDLAFKLDAKIQALASP